VAALGYFVDIFDLQLFNIISKNSLKGIGITDQTLIDHYDYSLFLWQMSGMLVGGLLWGIIGDKFGRRRILFGSILLYSLANLGNAFVTDIHSYEAMRFIAGLGLAGELGAAITLVNEIMHKEKRGYGTMVIVTMGALGAVATGAINSLQLEWMGLAQWQTMYIIGGLLGLALLALRAGTHESGMFESMKNENVRRGNFLSIFSSRDKALTYLACIGLGLPVWFCIGLLVKFARDFVKHGSLNAEAFDFPLAIAFTYIGLSVGDLLSALLSQWLRSRKKVIFVYLALTAVIVMMYLLASGVTNSLFYLLFFLLGASTGYWALFVTIASETFGSNIRATVTTTVPNFVRGATVPIVLSFNGLKSYCGMHVAAAVIGAICIFIAFLSWMRLKETFGRDLNFNE
jgi:MFS family permease